MLNAIPYAGGSIAAILGNHSTQKKFDRVFETLDALSEAVRATGLSVDEYTRRWLYRHPAPWDFFHTFESVAGRDLDSLERVAARSPTLLRAVASTLAGIGGEEHNLGDDRARAGGHR